MQVGITVILCSLLYTTVVLLVYLRKEKLNTFENRVYKALISLNIVGLLLEIGCCYFVINKDVSPVHNVLNVLGSIGVLMCMNLDISEIVKLVKYIKPVEFSA